MREYELIIKITIKSKSPREAWNESKIGWAEGKRDYIETGHHPLGIYHRFSNGYELIFPPLSVTQFLVPPSWRRERKVYLQKT